MAWISDQEYLKSDQYQKPNNLDARMGVHLRFSRNPYGWFRWVFDHLPVREGMRVLELGCGTGALWERNRARIPTNIHLVLSDYSLGMLEETRSILEGGAGFSFAQCDAQALPGRAACFDLVIANHMLYHVPDLPCALREIKRVLTPQGMLVAATNGSEHMLDLYELVRQFDPNIRQDNDSAARFGLENGAVQLKPFFSILEIDTYEDALYVTDASALAAYIISMWGTGTWTRARAEQLQALISQRINAEGGIFIRKSTGLFVAKQQV